jgi:hypothetical protein
MDEKNNLRTLEPGSADLHRDQVMPRPSPKMNTALETAPAANRSELAFMAAAPPDQIRQTEKARVRPQGRRERGSDHVK